MIPNLEGAITRVVRGALDRSDDSWVRIDCPPQYPLATALSAMGDVDRLGLLSPFDSAGFAAPVASDTAAIITGWRNAELGPRTVLVGSATGPEESGLRETRVITQAEVLRDWEEALNQHVDRAEYPSDRLRDLIGVLMDDAVEGRMEATAIEGYLEATLSSETGVIARAGAELWRLGLMADAELLSLGNLSARLGLNRATVDLLAFEPDGPAEERQIGRLNGSSAPVAKTARAYRDSLESSLLQQIELTDLRTVLEGTTAPPTQRVRRLLDLLDSGAAASPSGEVAAALAKSIEALDPAIVPDGNSLDARAPVEGLVGEIRIQLDAADESPWDVGAGETPGETEDEGVAVASDPLDQVVLTVNESASPRDASVRVRLTARDVAETAKQQDAFKTVPKFTPLVERFAQARLVWPVSRGFGATMTKRS